MTYNDYSQEINMKWLNKNLQALFHTLSITDHDETRKVLFERIVKEIKVSSEKQKKERGDAQSAI